MRSARQQRGLAGAAVLILVILALLAVALGRGAFSDEEAGLDQRGVTTARMTKITDALVAFVALNGRLPCPATGTLDTGDAAPDAATTACTDADGVVPWKSLALRRDEGLDGWGRKISYRVYGGPFGFTQTGGANMTNCNSSLGFPLDAALDPGALCKSGTPPPNMPIQFFTVRGNMLVVEDAGTTRNGNAFVLVSHGDSGYGAFPADGATARTTLPSIAGREFTNTQATGTYWVLPRSAPGTPASDTAHFDDVVTYLSATDLVTRAKLAARSWAELNIPLSAEFTLPAVTAAAPGITGAGLDNYDAGQAFLGIGGFLVVATDSTGFRNVGARTEDGTTGIGVFSGEANGGDLNSSLGERLVFLLGSGSEFQKMDIALNRFRVVQVAPTRLEERAEVSFWRGGDVLQTSVVTSWVEPVQPARCLFALVPSAVFDRMDIRPISRTGDGDQTTFTVAAVKACNEATASCATTVANALDCPVRPPSASSTAAATITATAADLQGFAHDNGAATAVSFDYGTTCSYPSNIAATPANLVAGAGNTTVTAALAGLACNTSYYFRTKAVSAGGTTTGNDAMFTTDACAFPMPVATTGAIGPFVLNPDMPPYPPQPPPTYRTTLHAIVNDNGSDTTVTFDYGPSNCYGSSVSSLPLPGTVTAGSGAKAVFAVIGDPDHPTTPTPPLACNLKYHFRVRAVSGTGTTTGSDVAFTTPPCS